MNGLPLVVIEAKTPVRSSESWFDGATQVHDDYERNVPELFVPNVCSAATEGKDLRYGSIGLPVELWGPWRADDDTDTPALERIKRTISSMLRPHTVLDLLGSYTAYATDKGKRRAKIVARYQQVEAANRIVERVVAGHPKKGLVWHFQGSGKSLLMLFAARKLRLHPALGNPTVIIVVDRIDLDTQISSTFHAADAPNLEKADSRADLERLLAQDARKIIITTIFKFGEVDGVLNDRHNIIMLVDEAHRSQEGDLGRKMRRALPNAFLFGLTGTPINRADRNTFFAFGAEEDEYGYLSRYGFEESVRDGATKPLHFEPRLPELHIDRDAIDAEYQALTGGLSDLDREQLSKTAARTAVLLKTPERVERICADIARHFQEKVAPNGFGAQVVTYDRESCVLYKQALDKVLPAEMSDVVMTVNSGENEYAAYRRDRDAEERLLDPGKKSKEIEIKVAARLRKHLHDPRFRALGERLEALRQKHEQGLLVSIEFLKSLLELARDVVEAERTVEPATPEERGKAALTELFEEARNDRTPVMVERIVNDIDEIVRHVRFDGWQTTHAGEREVKKALRKTLFKYRLHQDQELFDRAYGYIRQHY